MRYAADEGRYGLVSFRLSDIPFDLRARAASALVRRAESALPDEQAGTAGLLATVLSRSKNDLSSADTIKRVAERPSDKLYWIPRPAWESVMHPKNRRTC